MTGSLQPPRLDGAQTGDDRPTPEAVHRQLERILEDPLFKRSTRLSAFLRYVVDQTLAGRADGIKEPTLALELYGRDSDFDAGLDPIVRVDARRLRDKLREYYLESPSEPIIITLPKGGYVPAFEPAKPTQPVAQNPIAVNRSNGRQWAIWTFAIIAVAVSAGLLYSRRPNNSSSAVLRPLASLPGLKGPPSLSPDGTMVVFFWSGPSDKPAPGLYIKAVDGEDLRRLVTADAAAEPAWSPTGSNIAFSRSGPGGGVFVVSQVGGPERRIPDSGNGATWTPDGATVLFHGTFLLDTTPGAFRQGLFSVALQTLEKRQLTRAEAPIGDVKAAVSPDGSTVAFIRSGIPGLSDVYVVPMAGGEPRRVTDWNILIEGLAWTPDGKEIVYGVYEPVGPRLWRIAASASPPGRGVRLEESTGDAVFPSISKVNSRGLSRLAYFTRRLETSLRLVDLTERDASSTLITSNAFQRSSRWDYGGRLSPDGRLVAFISNRTGTAEVWLSALDGSSLRRLTDIKGDPSFVFWSGDSRRLSFLSAPGRTGNKRIYTVGIDGGDPTPLTGEAEVVLPGSWSRDGRWIYFMSDRSGEMQIWRMSPSGEQAVQVTRNGGFEAQESPDGAFVYYTNRPPSEPSGRENPVALMRVPANSGEETLVIPEIRTFHWTVAEDGIYFYSPGPPRSILRYRFDTGKTERVGNLPDQTATLDGDMSVSRDGQRLFMSQIERDDTDLTLIENFR